METNFKSMESIDSTMQPLKETTSQGLILQTHCNSVLAQQSVDFGTFDNLKKFEKSINDSLNVAKTNANHYLKDIQKVILANITNMWNYYELHSNIPVVCPEGSTEKEWLEILKGMQDQAETYRAECDCTSNLLIDLNEKLGTDASKFSEIVTNLNSVVGGDEGVLSGLQKDLSKVDKQIAGCIAGTVLGGLAIVGGGFLAAVGGITDFITAGTSTPLVIGGVALLTAGVATEIGTGITLGNLYKQKATLLTTQTSLNSEVQLATGIESAYKELFSNATKAMNATIEMSNAWRLLGGDLHNMADDLEAGRMNAGMMRKIFLTAANQTIPVIKTDLTTIKEQMTGVKVQTVKGMSLSDFILKQTNAA